MHADPRNLFVRHSSQRGFSLIEMVVIVAIVAVLAAIAIPNWRRMNDNILLRRAARTLASAIDYTRQQSILVERPHFLFFQTGFGVDQCANPIPAPITVLDDLNGNCCFDAGEASIDYFTDPAIAGMIGWGVSNAAGPVPQDPGGGVMGTGSSFLTQLGAPTTHVAFRPDGVPVVFDNTCTRGQIGTGGGAFYLTNARPGLALPARRDLSVVLTPLGSAKVYLWDTASGVWTQ